MSVLGYFPHHIRPDYEHGDAESVPKPLFPLLWWAYSQPYARLSPQTFISGPLPFMCGPPKTQAATPRRPARCIWEWMGLAPVWWWSCCAGSSAVLPGLLRVASVGPLPGHCCVLLVSCPRGCCCARCCSCWSPRSWLPRGATCGTALASATG